MEGAKKATRSEKGRHLNQNRRVAARMAAEAWKASWAELVSEDIFSYQSGPEQREAAAWEELGMDSDVFSFEIRRKFRFDQVNCGKNTLFPAFKKLDRCLVFKRALPDPFPSEKELAFREGVRISRDLSTWLRDKVARSWVEVSRQDGSVALSDLAYVLGQDEEAIYFATSVKFDRNGKKRFVVFEKIEPVKSVFRVCALGGHFFKVFSPPGLYPICLETAKQLKFALHRTNSGESIKKEGVLSSMNRPGGVNLSLGDSPGYRDGSSHLIRINLENAIEHADFMHNRISNLVFGLGNWSFGKSWWDGKVPVDEKFMTITEID